MKFVIMHSEVEFIALIICRVIILTKIIGSSNDLENDSVVSSADYQYILPSKCNNLVFDIFLFSYEIIPRNNFIKYRKIK